MSEAFKAKCEVFFNDADADGTGALSRLELCKVAKSCGVKEEVDEISSWFDDLDKNDDDKITFAEFWDALNKKDPKLLTEAELRSAFKEIDADGTGSIGLDELKSLLGDHGQDPDSAQAVLDLVDKDDDGKVNFEEFLVLFKQS